MIWLGLVLGFILGMAVATVIYSPTIERLQAELERRKWPT